jgi:hypothetical protein
MSADRGTSSYVGGLALFLALVVLPGCGPGGPRLVPVSGQVLIDGQPLAAGVPGSIRVVPADSRAATGNIDPQTGRFTLFTFEPGDGCPVGTHKVAVIVRTMVGTDSVSLIPENYSDEKTSDLTVTISGPQEDLEIKLSGPFQRLPDGAAAPISDDPNKF